MKILFERDALLRSLSLATAMVQSISVNPPMRYLRITAGEKIAIASANMAGQLEIEAKGEIETPGTCCVPAKEFAAWCRSLKDGSQVEIEFKGDKLHLRSGRSNVKLPTFPVADWTERSGFKAQVVFEVATSLFLSSITEVEFATSQKGDPSRPFANAICFCADKNGHETSVAAVATDGHRISYTVLIDKAPGNWPDPPPSIPRDQLPILRKILSEVEVVKVGLSGGNIGITGQGIKYRGSIMVDPFPNWRAAMPSTQHRIEFSRLELEGALRRLMTVIEQDNFEDDKGSKVRNRSSRFEFLDGKITIGGMGNDGRSTDDEIDAVRSGEDLSFGLNCIMLGDLLNAFKCETMACLYSDDAGLPLVFMDAGFASVEESDRFCVQVTQRG